MMYDDQINIIIEYNAAFYVLQQQPEKKSDTLEFDYIRACYISKHEGLNFISNQYSYFDSFFFLLYL